MPTVRIAGVNLQVVNGQNNTSTANGSGNVIIGYNEFRGGTNNRTGSHMLCVGREHNYTRFGGAVLGTNNASTGDFACVTGGRFNTASGFSSSIQGGENNNAPALSASIAGGIQHNASGAGAAIAGGSANTASGQLSAVSGGQGNNASGGAATVSGGLNLTASSNFQHVP